MLELLSRVPLRRFLPFFDPFGTGSEPRLTKALRTNRRGVLISELHPTARTELEERGPPIEAPGRVVEAESADTAAVRVTTGH